MHAVVLIMRSVSASGAALGAGWAPVLRVIHGALGVIHGGLGVIHGGLEVIDGVGGVIDGAPRSSMDGHPSSMEPARGGCHDPWRMRVVRATSAAHGS